MRNYIKIGVAGPVGAGKTALIEKLTREMASKYSVAVITNDIYTQEDAEFLTKNSLLPPERIMGVETGGCPHTAIRHPCPASYRHLAVASCGSGFFQYVHARLDSQQTFIISNAFDDVACINQFQVN